ncbi:MAG: hypothetical protein R3F43_25415 [bacterium]
MWLRFEIAGPEPRKKSVSCATSWCWGAPRRRTSCSTIGTYSGRHLLLTRVGAEVVAEIRPASTAPA